MTLFSTLILKFLPAFSYMFIGYIGKRYWNLSQNLVTNALFYILMPIAVFKSALFLDTQLLIVLITFCIITRLILVGVADLTYSTFSSEVEKGVLRCIYPFANIGFFGVPIVYSLLGEGPGNIMIGIYVGGMIYSNTFGYLIMQGGTGESILSRLLRLPTTYALILGLCLHFFFLYYNQSLLQSISMNSILNWILHLNSKLTALFGMGLVGMSIAGVKVKSINWGKINLLLIYRVLFNFLVIWTSAYVCLYFNWIDHADLQVILLIPLLPVAANILVFSNKFGKNSDFTGVVLLASTILSCILMLIYFYFNLNALF